MDIKWSSLGEVALVSLAVGVGVVVIFTLGVLAWSLLPRSEATERGGTEPSSAEPIAAGAGANPAVLRAAAGLCFLACALIVGYGLYLIVPQFH
jgi:hypothetical protein